MIKLITSSLLLLSFNSLALEFKKVKEDGASHHEQAFVLEEKKMTFIKKSNFFDSSEDYRIGTFSADIKNAVEIKKELEAIKEKIGVIDDHLKANGKTFNDLSYKVPGHQAFFDLEGFVVKSGSEIFKELEKLFSVLSTQDWKMVEGIELTEKFAEIKTIKNDKVVKTEKFDIRFSCEKEAPPTICKVKNVGLILIGK